MFSNFVEVVCFKTFRKNRCFLSKLLIFFLGLALSVSLLVVWDAAVQIISKSLLYRIHSKQYVITKKFSIFLINEKAACFLQINVLFCSVESMASADLPA